MAAVKSIDSVKVNDFFKEKDFSSLNFNYDPKNFEEVKEGSVIYSAGTQSDCVYLLIVGEVKIKFTVVKRLLFKYMNDFFGETEVLKEKNRNSSAVANTDCTIYKIDAITFRKLVNDYNLMGDNVNEIENIGIDDVNASISIDHPDQDIDSDTIKLDLTEDVESSDLLITEAIPDEIKIESEDKEIDHTPLPDELSVDDNNYDLTSLTNEIPDLLEEQIINEETETEITIDEDQTYSSNQQPEVEQEVEHEIADENFITPGEDDQSFLQEPKITDSISNENQTPSLELISKFILPDVKAPLLTIKHYTNLISKFDTSEEVKKIVSLLSTQTTFILDLIQSSIDYSVKSLQLKLEKLSFNDSMNNILTLLSDYVESRNIKLFKKFDVDAVVTIDPRKFYVACYHISRFACDLMPDGGNLYFSSQHEGDNLLLNIKDTGHGIKDELINKIFDPVYKDGEEEKTGLGLAIAKYILESMNCKIKLESYITGTIYTIALPKDSY